MKPTPEQVWEAVLVDPKFAEQMPEGSPQRDAIRPFIEGSVDALDDQLDTPVTLQAIIDAKLTFLRYCMDNGLPKFMSDALGMGEGMITGMFQQITTMLSAMLEDVNAFLEARGATEYDVMMSPQIGLSVENQRKWHAGTLTIGELLATQPGVILQNDS